MGKSTAKTISIDSRGAYSVPGRRTRLNPRAKTGEGEKENGRGFGNVVH